MAEDDRGSHEDIVWMPAARKLTKDESEFEGCHSHRCNYFTEARRGTDTMKHEGIPDSCSRRECWNASHDSAQIRKVSRWTARLLHRTSVAAAVLLLAAFPLPYAKAQTACPTGSYISGGKCLKCNPGEASLGANVTTTDTTCTKVCMQPSKAYTLSICHHHVNASKRKEHIPSLNMTENFKSKSVSIGA
jgi:hypothetical protein